MKNAIILHGTCGKEEYFGEKYPSLSNSNWIPWLQKQLIIRGIHNQTPEMPRAYEPDYGLWKGEFEKFYSSEELLIGYSCGAGFLLRWLSENQVSIRHLVPVAPWLDPKRARTEEFFEFQIDESLNQRIEKIDLLYSENDREDVLKSVEIIKGRTRGLKLHQFPDKGHFTYEQIGASFPELLQIILARD